MILRALSLKQLLARHYSIFLFGPRGTGKTSLLNGTEGIDLRFDLLSGETLRGLSLDPNLFRSQVEAIFRRKAAGPGTRSQLVAIDEIQLLPQLLNEVHFLIEKYRKRLNFILTGSSARKLKRAGTNMLAGRAIQKRLYPLCQLETELDLYRALQFGTLPRPYLEDDDPREFLSSYVDTYLREEIKQESLVRKLDAFIRFLDLAAQMNGENINYSKLGRACGVAGSTIEQYYSIIEDTLLVLRLDGWSHSVRKQLVLGPRYYFFDCGVLNALRRELHLPTHRSSFRFGKLFESFVINEVKRIFDYRELDYKLHYWRTNSGLEVDLVLSRSAFDKPIAIEIKASPAPEQAELRGLNEFQSENKGAKLFCICQAEKRYSRSGIHFIPWNTLGSWLEEISR